MLCNKLIYERQLHSTDCAVAALRAVLRSYRMNVPDRYTIDSLLGGNASGATVEEVQRAAYELGLTSYNVEVPLEEIHKLPLPAIAVVETDAGRHYVAILRANGRRFWVSDPAVGRRKISRECFASIWVGDLIVTGTDPSRSSLLPDGEEVAPWRFLLKLCAREKLHFVVGHICAFFRAIIGLAGLLIFQQFVDVLARGEDERQAFRLVAGIALTLVMSLVFEYVFEHCRADLKRRTESRLKKIYAARLGQVKPAALKKRTLTDLLRPFTSDIAQIRDAVATMLAVPSELIKTALLLSVLAFCAPKLAVTIGLCLLTMPCIALLLTLPIRRAILVSRTQNQKCEHYFKETLRTRQYLKSSNAGSDRAMQSVHLINKAVQDSYSLSHLRVVANILGKLAAGCIRVLALILAVAPVVSGGMAVGSLFMLYLVLIQLLESVRHSVAVSIDLPHTLLAVERLCDVLSTPIESDSPDGITLSGIERSIAFDGVSLPNADSQHGASTEVSFTIPARATSVLIEESGRASAVIAPLLLRLIDCDAGQIRIDNKDIRDVRVESLRNSVACVSDGEPVLRGTIRQNICVGRPGATQDMVMAASVAAGLHVLVNRQPKRYDEIIGGNDGSLSRRMLRCLSMARALLREPSCVVICATRAWSDPWIRQNEGRVIRDHLFDRTVIVIARPGTVVPDATATIVLADESVAKV